MHKFYIKNESGDFIEADDKVDELFRQKSDKIVATKLSSERERVKKEIHDEIAETTRNEELENIKKQLTDELSKSYQEKVDAADKKAEELGAQLRRKTIAAEYGFKTEAEEFLGNGSEEDMRAKADTLKASFGGENTISTLEKETKDTSISDGFVTLCE